MTNVDNTLLCDIETGVCALPGTETNPESKPAEAGTPLKLIYFTDPICSSCWGIEPQLRKLKLEYGEHFEIEYRMGGLLPNWSYNSGGIGGPADVARHWDEASAHYDMPIDGDVWLEDPLHSSYPPSIAFKAAQLQDKQKAESFLRAMRELLFLQKKNIAKWEHLAAAALTAGLDLQRLEADMNTDAKQLFEADLRVAKTFAVRGFPTIFFVDETGEQEMVYGSRPYAYYEMAILKLKPNAQKKEYLKSPEHLFKKFRSLTAKEFAELSGTPRKESEMLLYDLSAKNVLQKTTTKNGSIWHLLSHAN